MIGHDRANVILKKLSCHQALSASGGSQVQFARSAPRVARALQIVRNSVPHRPGPNSHSETGPGSCRWLCRAAPRIIPMSGLKAYCTDLRDRSPMRTVRSPIRCSSSLMISGLGVKASTVIVSLVLFRRLNNIMTKMPLYTSLGRSSCPLNTSSFPAPSLLSEPCMPLYSPHVRVECSGVSTNQSHIVSQLNSSKLVNIDQAAIGLGGHNLTPR